MTRAHRGLGGRLLASAVLALAIIAVSCGDDATQPTASPVPSSPGSGSFEASPPSGDGAPSSVPGDPDYDAARALEHVRKLSVEIGRRAAGSAAEKQAADYIRQQLAGYGYRAELQGFTFESFDDTGTALAVLSPHSQDMVPRALQPSVNGSVEGELVAAGIGRSQEFPAGSGGKIALIQRGDLTFTEKVANAAAAGATGTVIYNNKPGTFAGELDETSAIPAISVSGEDGEALLALVDAGPVTVRLRVVTKVTTEGSQNVVAEAPGHECRVVLGGHYDSVPAGPGANDNASGTATVLEIARTMAADGQMDDVCFALFGSEEVGLVGSAHYVEALTAVERDRIVGMLNFDMLAVGSGWPLLGSSELVDVVAAEAKRLDLLYEVSDSSPPNVGSDHARFIDAGIPAVLFNCFCDDRYHTPEDRFEFVQRERLAEAGALGLAVVNALLKR